MFNIWTYIFIYCVIIVFFQDTKFSHDFRNDPLAMLLMVVASISLIYRFVMIFKRGNK